MVESYSDGLLVPFAKYLNKYAKKWELSDIGGSILVPLDYYHFDSLIFRPKKIPYSLDKTWEFIANVNIYEQDEFLYLKNGKKMFQSLKGMECILQKKGTFKKSYHMINNPMLHHLKKEIIDFKIDDSLSKRIEVSNRVMEDIKKINPENFSIQLYSKPIVTKDIEEYSREFKKIYLNPTEGLIWNIIIEKYLDSIIRKKSYTKILDLIIEVINTISDYIINISKQKIANYT